jgi:hypothetical protein
MIFENYDKWCRGNIIQQFYAFILRPLNRSGDLLTSFNKYIIPYPENLFGIFPASSFIVSITINE